MLEDDKVSVLQRFQLVEKARGDFFVPFLLKSYKAERFGIWSLSFANLRDVLGVP